MTLSRLISLLAIASLAAGCNLLNTSDPERARGRGAKAFDPYASTASGAISLSLIHFNGCAILPDGRAISPGNLDIPYPEMCEQRGGGLNEIPAQPPTAEMPVMRGQMYFLNQFIAMHTVYDKHTDYNDRSAPLAWVTQESLFRKLDWSSVGIGREDWRPNSPPAWQRETYYENAAWMRQKDATIKVEVLDSDGAVRASQIYRRDEFLAENPYSGRSRVSWMVNNVLPPHYPSDPVMHPWPERPAIFQTSVKVAFSSSANPFKTFQMPDISGEGVIRVTWSQMPDDPFLFPVKFVNPQEVPRTCYRVGPDGFATNERVPCTFGLTQEVRFNKPKNGKFFVPGEKVDFMVSFRDGEGNGLHPRDLLPSLNDYMSGQSNGLLYFNDFMVLSLKELSASESGFMLAGPLHKLRFTPKMVTDYFRYPDYGEPHFYAEPPGIREIIPGAMYANPPARFTIPLPENAEPGTYALYLKGHRYFMGERLNRLDPVFFQVGQEQETSYPNRVGNCQICHNGVLSLQNVMHGLPVDHVEGCKSCHNEAVVGHTADLIHRIHSSSGKYPQPKADCSICHLTRESAVTPSLNACGGCHPNTHNPNYFHLQFQFVDVTPNAYTNCANACHVNTTPNGHVLPKN